MKKTIIAASLAFAAVFALAVIVVAHKPARPAKSPGKSGHKQTRKRKTKGKKT
jgi:uncharacterized low-complexity protein